MIMHGTETPAQPNDAIKIDIPQSDLNSFGDIDQNSLDFDAPQSSGQWRNMQQVSDVIYFPVYDQMKTS